MSRTTIIIARIAMVIYIALVAYICFGNFTNLPNIPRKLWGYDFDKVVHFVMFLPFPILAYFSFGKLFKSPVSGLLFMLCVFLIGCLIAAGTEMGQTFTKYRTGDRADFRADALALAISSLLTFIIMILQHLFRRK